MMDGYLVKGMAFKSVVGGKEYETERFQGEHANEYCVYEVKNGVRDGIAELFDDGIVKMRWRMKKGVRDGEYVLYENGVVVREGRWKDVGSDEERIINNEKYGLHMMVRVDGIVVYEGEFNESIERDGWGLEFENGVMKRYGKWRNDELVEVKQRFVSETEMIEYGDGATNDLFSHRPMYKGGYVFNEVTRQVLRNGPGRVFTIWNGICEYESEWENGKEVPNARVALHDGWYCEHSPGESAREAVTGEKPMMIGNRVLINEPSHVEELIIANNDYNDSSVTDLKLNGLSLLRRIEIGDRCFQNVNTFELTGLNALKSVTIGERSVTGWNGSCSITDCPVLTSICIGNYSFGRYPIATFKNLPSLQRVDIGSCFQYVSSFYLNGIPLDVVQAKIFFTYSLWYSESVVFVIASTFR